MYQRDGEPSRNLAIFDGLDLVDQTIGSARRHALRPSWCRTPGFDAKLGVIAYEGEAQLTGDSLRFKQHHAPRTRSIRPTTSSTPRASYLGKRARPWSATCRS